MDTKDSINEIYNNPRGLVMLNSSGLTSLPAIEYETLPGDVRCRVRALKNLLKEATTLEKQYFDEIQKLEYKYHKLYEPLHKKRSQIVSGEYEPTAKEATFSEPEFKPDSTQNSGKKGIPNFWLTVLKNVDLTASMIESRDEEILKHLIDLRMILSSDGSSYTLEFEFEENDFFTNKVLTKTYQLVNEIDLEDPFAYEGPEIRTSTGCKIDFKSEELDPRYSVKSKSKNRKKGVSSLKKELARSKSFFDFFDPPQVGDNNEEVSAELESRIREDFEIGDFIRQSVIQNAVLFFTGEFADYDEDDESDSEEFSSEEDSYSDA